jgi:hypothetical protein
LHETKNKEGKLNMKAKNKKEATKSTKTRLSDLKPGKDARGGRSAPRPDGGPSYSSSILARYKKIANA